MYLVDIWIELYKSVTEVIYYLLRFKVKRIST